ncbi:hypothetical protein [Candidatus Nitrospira neomarina]|uniref:Uncharacterized protein n=1 Tax=Candidatus Nitrospira neomarina TaxID=3020899 RepID=A0AA96K1Q9_9BACT|nr:hypothetical protein [Candidatus Nitrospira neomarina]WNM63346.1 hypothetical protein PQG83_06215 [Candidatus Nitrospira neomarina]
MAQTRAATDKSVPPGGQPEGVGAMGRLLVGAFAWLAALKVRGKMWRWMPITTIWDDGDEKMDA